MRNKLILGILSATLIVSVGCSSSAKITSSATNSNQIISTKDSEIKENNTIIMDTIKGFSQSIDNLEKDAQNFIDSKNINISKEQFTTAYEKMKDRIDLLIKTAPDSVKDQLKAFKADYDALYNKLKANYSNKSMEQLFKMFRDEMTKIKSMIQN